MARARSHARAIARIGLIVATTAALVASRFLIAPMFWVVPGSKGRVTASLSQVWARALVRILGIRCCVSGRPPVPPVLLVSNHLGYVDILVLLRVCPGVFVAKAEVARWPVLGFLARFAGTLFVDRERRRDLPRVIAAMTARLGGGQSVILFPEATSSPGVEVLPFRAALFEASLRSEVPVCGVAIRYELAGSAAAAADTICWWGEMTFPDHLYRLLQLRGVYAKLSFGDRRLRGSQREELAVAARQEVQSLFCSSPRGAAVGADERATKQPNLASTTR